jgi:hypothetical protein
MVINLQAAARRKREILPLTNDHYPQHKQNAISLKPADFTGESNTNVAKLIKLLMSLKNTSYPMTQNSLPLFLPTVAQDARIVRQEAPRSEEKGEGYFAHSTLKAEL